MKRTLNKLIRDEKGQALILTMILLLVGGLIITPLLGFMSTGLLVGQVFEKKMDGLYAADAGIEDALWKIMNDQIPDPYPALTVNGMSVTVVIEEVTTFYTLDVGEGSPSGHNVNFELEGELIDEDGNPTDEPYWDPGLSAFIHEWRLTLTNKTGSPVKVERIIVSYSNELSYLSGLTDDDIVGLDGSFESDNPGDEIVVGGIKIRTWDFPSPRPEIEAAPDPDSEDYTTVTTTFELEGPEDAAGITVILVTKRDDIGAVWEFKPFKIIATALADDGSTVVIEAGALEGNDTVSIGSWEIS